MIYRSRAPLRLGLAGGGTDVSPYSDIYGGTILNATISLYAHASIEPIEQNIIDIYALDRDEEVSYDLQEMLPIDGQLDLAKGIYNRIVQDYGMPKSGFRLSTYVDAPAGSGLGSSSTLVVAIIGAFCEWLNIPLGEYDIAQYAFDIERKDLQMAGGKQDQYAATFGGVNFMEFYADNKVIVNPLRVKKHNLLELEHNLLLFYTQTSRLSSKIIEAQSQNVQSQNADSINAMHHLKEQAQSMKEALLKGNINAIGEILDYGFQQKKQMAAGISNPMIEEVYELAKAAGATGGKISGAGGGGFMMFYCPNTTKYAVQKVLSEKGTVQPFHFEEHGLLTWTSL